MELSKIRETIERIESNPGDATDAEAAEMEALGNEAIAELGGPEYAAKTALMLLTGVIISDDPVQAIVCQSVLSQMIEEHKRRIVLVALRNALTAQS